MADLERRKELNRGKERQCLHRSTYNMYWLSSIPHFLNSTELSQEEFRDNLILRYGIIPQDVLVTCDSSGKKFPIYHILSCAKGGLVLMLNDCISKEWGALGYQVLTPSDISYEPQINSKTVKGEKTGAGA